MSPMWTAAPPNENGTVRHELMGQRVLARVDVVPVEKMTVINVLLAVDGTDEATVLRCKERAERVLTVVQKA